MADPTYTAGVFGKAGGTHTRDARFFSALLTAGYFGQKYVSVSEQYRTVLLSLLFAIPSAGLLLSLHGLIVMREDPSRFKDPAVLEGIKQSFVGATTMPKKLPSSF